MTLRFVVAPCHTRAGRRPAPWAAWTGTRAWTACCLLALSALAGPSRGAQIVPLVSPWLAACLRAGETTLLRQGPSRSLEQVKLRRVLDCLAAESGGRALGFSGCTAVRLGPRGEEECEWRLPDPVRCCLSMGDGTYLLLLGGGWEDGQLRQAHAALWRPEQNALLSSRQVLTAWNPFELAVEGPGRAGQQVLMAVRKTAPFDVVFRRRPFLFGYRSGDTDLVPLWKGTSVAHPHLCATLAHLGLARGPQLCALEQLQDSRRMLGVYGFTGRMQMVGASLPAQLGDKLAVLRGGPGATDLLVCLERKASKWRAVAYGAGNETSANGVCRLQPRLQTAPVVAAPIAWTVVTGRQGPGVVTLAPTGGLAFRALGPLEHASK